MEQDAQSGVRGFQTAKSLEIPVVIIQAASKRHLFRATLRKRGKEV